MRPTSPRLRLFPAVFGILALLLGGAGALADTADQVAADLALVDRLLEDWQFEPARSLAEKLLSEHPDLPAVQLVAGWVKFHFADHQAAAELVERAAAALGDRLEKDPRVGLVRAAARLTRGFVRSQSPDGLVQIFHAPGVDEILVPYLVETVQRTLEVVGRDLDFQVAHPVLVQLLPDDQALADATGLTVQEIDTSGTIAVCKYGRLMITSPRGTLKGFSWLDTASHELVHMIISEKTHNHTPIWLHEALARFEDSRWRAGEPLYREGLPPLTQSDLAAALRQGKLITFEQMHPSMALLPSQEAAELAFAEVYMVTRYLVERAGYPGIQALLSQLKIGKSDTESIAAVYHLELDSFVKAWTEWLGRQKLTELTGEVELRERWEKDRSASATEQQFNRERRIDLRDFFHLGQLLRARGRNRAAVAEYQKAFDRAGPRYAAVWMISDKLGLALLSIDRAELARAAFETSLRVQPQDEEAHFNLGRILLEKDPWEAWLHLREALRINPLDPRVQALSAAAAKALQKKDDRQQDWPALTVRYERATALLRQGATEAPAEAPPGPKEEDKISALRVHTSPWARLWVDYRDTGLTTPVYRLPVEPGTHLLGLQVSCLADPVVIPVYVPSGETVVVDRELCPGQNPVRSVREDRDIPAAQ